MATSPRISYKADVLSQQLLTAQGGIIGEPVWPGAPAPTAGDAFNAHINLENAINSIIVLEAQLSTARENRDTRIAEGRAIMQTIDAVTDALYTPSGAQKNNFGLTPTGVGGGPPPPPPEKIVIIKIVDGKLPASIFIDWVPQAGAASYEIEWFTSSAMTLATRVGNASQTRSEFETGTLTQGQQYWFRVRALRAGELGPWSDPATRVAGV